MVDKDIEERYAGVQHSAYLPEGRYGLLLVGRNFSSDYRAFLLEPRVNEQKFKTT